MAVAAAPADVMDTLIKEFECSICMDRLRNARCLFCQHTFCCDCLKSCVQSGREAANVITCPVCRVVTRLPRDGVAGLKSNALINSVLGKLEECEKTKNRGPNAEGDSKGQGSKPCESCKKSWTTAKYFCNDCRKHVCQECVQGGRHVCQEYVKGGKHHSLTSSGFDAAQNSDVHGVMPAKYYCCQCDKLYCRICNQSSHKTIPLHQKASNVRSWMQGLVDKCSDKNITIQTSHHKVNMSREHAVETLQKLMVEVRQKAAKVISKVKGKEEELLRYLEIIMQTAEEEMEEKQNKCSSLEDGLQAVVTEWQTLQSCSDAEMVRKHGSIQKKMDDLLKVIVTPSTELSRALKYSGLQFIPGKLYLEASCDGSELGELAARPDRELSHYVAARYDSVSQLMYMPNGTLLIADTWNGIDSVSQDHPDITTLLEGEIVRDLTVLADGTIVYQNNDKEIFKIIDNTSRKIDGFGGKWVSVTCCPSEGRDLIVVADQNYHNQDILFMDTLGNIVNTVHTGYVSGIRHLRFDKCQNAIFIDQNRRCVRCQMLCTDGQQKFVIAEEDTLYLAVACHQSDFLYVASQKASTPNVVTIKQHSLADGSLQATVLANEQVQNSFRMVMANWKDKILAYVKGNQVSVIIAATDPDVTIALQLEDSHMYDQDQVLSTCVLN